MIKKRKCTSSEELYCTVVTPKRSVVTPKRSVGTLKSEKLLTEPGVVQSVE